MLNERISKLENNINCTNSQENQQTQITLKKIQEDVLVLQNNSQAIYSNSNKNELLSRSVTQIIQEMA